MNKLKLIENGYITNYLISGPKLTDFIDDKIDSNQLRYEKYLRSIVADKCNKLTSSEIKLGSNSDIGMKWEYYYSQGNWFVDKSSFYPLLKKIDLLAAVNICVEEDMNVAAYLWTYAAMDVWLNSEHICCIDKAVYKPIIKKDMSLNLKKGENLLYIKMQNLGVRDTRNIFGIQILDNIDKITITLPDKENTEPFIKIEKWLSSIELQGNTLKFNEAAPCEVNLIYDSKNSYLNNPIGDFQVVNVTGRESVELRTDEAFIIVECTIKGQKLIRKIERVEKIKPKYIGTEISTKENMNLIYNRIADIDNIGSLSDKDVSINNILARIYLNGKLEVIDVDNLYKNLNKIESRKDCSDFLMSGLLRYMKNYSMEEKLQTRAKEVILNFRYWMDEKGSDGMCFWSENHALMFYSCAMIAGEMYPKDIFARSEKTGKEMMESGRDKVLQWLIDIEFDGYEEFLSAGYMCVTFGALLNVVDFGDKELSDRATKLVDRLLNELSLFTFKGSVIAPQGRVYRDVIYPYTQGVQAILNMINPKVPYCLNEWLIFMATSKYKVPQDLIRLMNTPVNKEHITGNALIKINKTKNYIMTSVQSPREDKNSHMWNNISLNEESDTTTYLYTKSINERFHGTTRFEPGVYGYQQHMWYAAIDIDTVVFANHPGGTFDESSMRPGYWYGNGVMPAVKQKDNVIGSIYVIPDNYPIHFTHLHWKKVMFNQVSKSGKWLFGEKNGAYIGVWCSENMQEVNDEMFNSEYRAYADLAAYVCYCSCKEECGSFETFKTQCETINPCFDKNTLTLTTSDDFLLHYEKCENLTQFI